MYGLMKNHLRYAKNCAVQKCGPVRSYFTMEALIFCTKEQRQCAAKAKGYQDDGLPCSMTGAYS
jgi:hypothetical protein